MNKITDEKNIQLLHGWSIKTYNYTENNKNYYFIEVYKDGEIEYFSETLNKNENK